jgi:type IV pilus assembly protein PilX
MKSNAIRHQQGAVLIVSLIFLVILTLLGLTAMTGTTMETRMANSSRDLGIAMNAAEAALRDAEWDIGGYWYPGKGGATRSPPMLPADFGNGGAAGTCNTGNSLGLCRARSEPSGSGVPSNVNASLPTDLVSPPALAGISLTASPSVPYGQFTGADALRGVAQQPRYLIESLCALSKPGGSIGAKSGSPCKYYRITSRGFGGNPNTRVTLSEIYTVH